MHRDPQAQRCVSALFDIPNSILHDVITSASWRHPAWRLAAQVNDVVLEVEGVPIADDGTIAFRNEERVEFTHIVRSKHIGAAAS